MSNFDWVHVCSNGEPREFFFSGERTTAALSGFKCNCGQSGDWKKLPESDEPESFCVPHAENGELVDATRVVGNQWVCDEHGDGSSQPTTTLSEEQLSEWEREAKSDANQFVNSETSRLIQISTEAEVERAEQILSLIAEVRRLRKRIAEPGALLDEVHEQIERYQQLIAADFDSFIAQKGDLNVEEDRKQLAGAIAWVLSDEHKTLTGEVRRLRVESEELQNTDTGKLAAKYRELVQQCEEIEQRTDVQGKVVAETVVAWEKCFEQVKPLLDAAVKWADEFAKPWKGCTVEGEPVMMGQEHERNLYDAVTALSIPPVIEQQETDTTTLVLNKYQRDNLLAALLAIGQPGIPTPMQAANTGDWLMEIVVLQLGWRGDDPSALGNPNQSYGEIAKRAAEWKPPVEQQEQEDEALSQFQARLDEIVAETKSKIERLTSPLLRFSLPLIEEPEQDFDAAIVKAAEAWVDERDCCGTDTVCKDALVGAVVDKRDAGYLRDLAESKGSSNEEEPEQNDNSNDCSEECNYCGQQMPTSGPSKEEEPVKSEDELAQRLEEALIPLCDVLDPEEGPVILAFGVKQLAKRLAENLAPQSVSIPSNPDQTENVLYEVDVQNGGTFTYDLIDVGRFAKAMAEQGDARPFSVKRKAVESDLVPEGEERHREMAEAIDRAVANEEVEDDETEWFEVPAPVPDVEKLTRRIRAAESILSNTSEGEESIRCSDDLWIRGVKHDCGLKTGHRGTCKPVGSVAPQPQKTLRDKRYEFLHQLMPLRGVPVFVLDELDKLEREHFDSKTEELNDYINDYWLDPSSAGDPQFQVLRRILFNEGKS